MSQNTDPVLRLVHLSLHCAVQLVNIQGVGRRQVVDLPSQVLSQVDVLV